MKVSSLLQKMPDRIIIDVIDKQVEKGFEINNILEPSFGSGEFLDDVKKYNANVIGVEKK
jgi:hypothetical protein